MSAQSSWSAKVETAGARQGTARAPARRDGPAAPVAALLACLLICAPAAADYDYADSAEVTLDLLQVETGPAGAWADSGEITLDLLSLEPGLAGDWADSGEVTLDLWPVHRGWGDSAEFTLGNEGDCGLNGLVVELDGQGQVLGPLADATVAVAGGDEQITGSDGQFAFGDLVPGPVTVTVSKAGYYPVTRELELVEGETRYETFQLLAEAGGETPGAFDFYSAGGRHLIEGMPGDLSFEVVVAWNGSPGGVTYTINGGEYPATLTDLGDGLALATVTVPAPYVVDTCREVTIEIVNGEGQTTWFNTGVHVSPIPGIIVPWYQDNIPWTPGDLALEFAYDETIEWLLTLEGADLKLGASLGYGAGLSYDLLGGSFLGELSGTGGFSFDWDVPGEDVEILGSGQLGASGGLTITLEGCEPPTITPQWGASFQGQAGLDAPAVLVVDVVFPPASPAIHHLLTIPVVKDVVKALRVRLFLNGDVQISGEYPAGQWSSECFLGAESIAVDGTLNLEAQVALELFGAEAGVYAGGTGTPVFEVCPDWDFQGVTLQAYVGVFAHAWLFEYSNEVGAEVCFGDCGGRGVRGGTLLDEPPDNGRWRPIGDRLLRWGEANRLAHAKARRLPGSNSIEKSGRALEQVLVENVTQLAGPSVIADPDATHITYTLHDPNKPWDRATDIASVRSVGGAPWTMERIADDDMADYDPALAPVGADSDLAAWEQVDGDVSGAEDPGDVAPYLEIAAAWFDRTTGEWTAPVLIEDNDVVDRAPRPAVFGGTTGIVWIQNEGDASPGDASSGDRLMFSAWDGAGWSPPQQLWSGPKGILSLAFAEDADGEGHVVFAVDEDGDLETTADRELYGVETAGGTWQAAGRLTADTVEDALPVLVAPGGEVLCVWASGSDVVYTALASWSPQPVYAEYTLANEAPSLDGVTMPGGAAVAYTVQHGEGVDLVAAFYDAVLDQWSLPRQLTQDEHAESAVSLACDGTQLVMSYLKTQTERNEVDIEIDGQVYHLTDVPQPGRTDLCVLWHALGHDLAVAADSLLVTPANPIPGTAATLTATVENRGELVAEGVEVAFYDGDPEAGGTLIGSPVTIPGALIAGSSCQVSTTWDVPTFPLPHDLYVVVDPGLVFDDRDRANNTATRRTILPDLVVESAWSNPVTPITVALTARVANVGVIPSGSFELSWRLGAVDGTEIGRSTVDSIVPGGAQEVTFWWDAQGYPPGAWEQVYLVTDDLAEVAEADETNNVHVLAVMVPLRPTGDLNCDGAVNSFDIDPFILALTDPAAYGSAYPNCDRNLADINGDGIVNAFDIDPFIALLVEG